MSELESTPEEKPSFRRVSLEKVRELRDLKETKKQLADSLSEKLEEIYRDFPEGRTGSIEQSAANTVMRKHRTNVEFSRLGIEVWQNNKVEGVVTEKWQEPFAGVFMAILGSAQELTPDGIDRIQKARPLQENPERDFMALSKFYDDMVEDSLRPGCVGRMMGRKGRTMEEIVNLEERLVVSLEKPSVD